MTIGRRLGIWGRRQKNDISTCEDIQAISAAFALVNCPHHCLDSCDRLPVEGHDLCLAWCTVSKK
jgi:hypothetical protein